MAGPTVTVYIYIAQKYDAVKDVVAGQKAQVSVMCISRLLSG